MATDSAVVSHVHEQLCQAEVDAALERRIECARIARTLATDEISRRDHLERMERLIGQRSLDQVARMEAKIEGLR
jgi:uncharacterized protein YbcI